MNTKQLYLDKLPAFLNKLLKDDVEVTKVKKNGYVNGKCRVMVKWKTNG